MMSNEKIGGAGKLKAALAAGVEALAIAGNVAAETVYNVECRNAAGVLLWTDQVKNRVTTAGLNKLLDATFKTGLTSPTWSVGLVSTGYTDGVTTASSTTHTSATAGFAAGDVGRAIILRGAGAAGADLVTTIASVTNSTTAVLTVAATTSLTGVKCLFDARAADTSASHASWTESAAYSETTRQAFTPGSISAGSVDNSGSKAVFTINADNTLIGGLFMIDNSTKSGATGTLYGMAPFTTVGFRQVNSGDTLSVTATLSVSAT
jgi:hypothetical protein